MGVFCSLMLLTTNSSSERFLAIGTLKQFIYMVWLSYLLRLNIPKIVRRNYGQSIYLKCLNNFLNFLAGDRMPSAFRASHFRLFSFQPANATFFVKYMFTSKYKQFSLSFPEILTTDAAYFIWINFISEDCFESKNCVPKLLICT